MSIARHGRGEEAFTLLLPQIEDWFLAAALVDVAEGAGRDEDAAALLAARIEAPQGSEDPSCRRSGVKPDNAVYLLAAIRERQGRIDDAIALLHSRDHGQLADLLARHGRIEELRAYAATEHHGRAAQRLAELLEERGDVEGAIAVYRQPGDPQARRRSGAVQLKELLVRRGRGIEAIEVMRSLGDSPGGAEDWIVRSLCALYADHGRAQDGLDYLDALKAHHGEEEWGFFEMRLPLMAACGRRQEAIDLARAHPEGDTWYGASSIAELLADDGRIEEVVAVLEPHPDGNRSELAWYLVDLGRVKDAVALLQQR
ncbi:tetratricopeptide repeat protein [Kitasatospora sp. NPDC001175]|uniref:tetratricopeptide repeat protein n=1 Tax=Kitasatospora sp. NPDC001175 TaxID=3157103 RepID=UPI003D00FBE8